MPPRWSNLVTKEGAILAEFELEGSYYAAGLSDDDLIVIDQYDRDDLAAEQHRRHPMRWRCARDDIENEKSTFGVCA